MKTKEGRKITNIHPPSPNPYQKQDQHILKQSSSFEQKALLTFKPFNP